MPLLTDTQFCQAVRDWLIKHSHIKKDTTITCVFRIVDANGNPLIMDPPPQLRIEITAVGTLGTLLHNVTTNQTPPSGDAN